MLGDKAYDSACCAFRWRIAEPSGLFPAKQRKLCPDDAEGFLPQRVS
jgi:hypothetical protein